MAVEVPDWFVEKYSTPGGQSAPVETPRSSVYRQFMNLELADTQQEREKIHASVQKSITRAIDTDALERLSNRYGVDEPDESNILLTTKKAEAVKRDPFSKPPVVRAAPELPEGKKVFTDQKRFEEIVASAPEEGRLVSFKQAFKTARETGKKEFEYKGDRFNTREKGETEARWLSALNVNKVDMPKQTSVPVEPDEVEPEFTDFMKKLGVRIPEGKNVDAAGVSENLGPALNKVVPVMREAGITPELTSGRRNRGVWSLHEVGEAVDLRLNTASPEALKSLKDSLPGDPIRTSIHGEKGEMWSDGTYEYIIHGTGDNIHLHIERETKDSKQKLIDHLIEEGKSDKIPKRGLTKYPSLLKQYASVEHTVS